MNRPQFIRRLRIAASVFFALMTVALCVLWVRSYWRSDVVARSVAGGSYMEIKSICGGIRASRQSAGHDLPSFWGYRSSVLGERYWPSTRISWGSRGSVGRIHFPHWLPVIVTMLIATLCWKPIERRFSLRTLLIATTLVAVALGLGVWASR